MTFMYLLKIVFTWVKWYLIICTLWSILKNYLYTTTLNISTKRVNNSTTLCNPGINNYIS